MMPLAVIAVISVILAASVIYGEVAVIAGWDLRQFSLHLASVVRQNLPLAQGLRAFAEGEAGSPALSRRMALDNIASHLEEGMPLADAMDTESASFPPHYRALVRAGERGGNLARVFARLAETSRADGAAASSSQDIIQLVMQLVVMGSVFAIIRIVVLPQFLDMFEEVGHYNARIAMLFTVSALFLPMALALGVIAFVGLPMPGLGGRLKMWVPVLGRASARMRWWMPVFSRYERRRAVSRYCIAAGELLHAGIPSAEAFAIAAGASGNLVFDRIAMDAANRVAEGAKLSEALAAADTGTRLPRELAWYIKLGEASGRLPDALARASESAEARSRTILAKLVNLMLPATTLVFGFFVGAVCLAMIGVLVDLTMALAG
jgi:type II secretory pathway component PulF